jgi:competence protein ComEC
MLWDCGSLARSDAGARTLPRAARALGITRIPVAVLTHPNLDHYNGLLDAARTMGLRTLLVGDATLDEVMASDDTRLGVMLREMERRGVNIRRVSAGDTLEVGGARVEFIWPADGFVSREPNERSLVARIDVGPIDGEPAGSNGGRADVLLTGDIQSEAIDAIIAAHPDLRAIVMEAPHHGSVIRESRGLFVVVDPEVVHQSTGPRRAEGDPWEVEREGRWWGVTATDGALWTEVLRDGSTRSGSMRSRE